MVFVLSASGARTRTRTRPTRREYEYHFIDYEYDWPSKSATSKLTRRVGIWQLTLRQEADLFADAEGHSRSVVFFITRRVSEGLIPDAAEAT